MLFVTTWNKYCLGVSVIHVNDISDEVLKRLDDFFAKYDRNGEEFSKEIAVIQTEVKHCNSMIIELKQKDAQQNGEIREIKGFITEMKGALKIITYILTPSVVITLIWILVKTLFLE